MRRAKRHAAGVVLLTCLALGITESCTTIEAASPGICGNAVVDHGSEDCDGFERQGMPCRAPGVAGECRFDCTESQVCGLGFGCGADGICRAPSGKLELAQELDEDAVTLRAIALDDDDVPDLLVGSTGDPVALFLRDDFDVDLDVDLRTPVGAALIASADLTGDDLPDLAFPSGRGIQVLRGGDREFSGTAYATFTIPPVSRAVVGTIDAYTSLAGAEPVVLVQFGEPAVTYALLADPNIIDTEVIKAISETANPLPLLVAGESPAIDVIVGGQLDPSTSCDELVLAFRNDDRVVIATPCTQNDTLNGAPFDPNEAVDLPIGMLDVDLSACDIGVTPFPVDRAFVVDVDGDGQDDILVTPEVTGAPVSSCVAYGPVELENVVTMMPAVAPLAVPYSNMSFTLGERAFATQRMNLDDELDVITSMGIFLSAASCPQGFHAGDTLCDRTPGMAGTHVFTEAALGDFNGDARLDVAAAENQSDLLFVFLGHDDDTFAEFIVEPDGDPRSLVAGDFDGDGVDDVGFAAVCNDCEASEASDSIVVSFGAVAGGPTPPQSFGTLGNIRQVLASSFPEPTTALDGAADLGVLFSDSSNPNAFRFATMFGSTTRELQAPFVIVKSESRQEQFLYRPLQVLIGDFAQPSANEPLRKDIAAFAYLDEVGLDPKLDMRIWLLTVKGEAELSTSRSWSSEPLALWDDWDQDAGFAAIGNLDADETDEIVYTGGSGFLIANVVEVDGHPQFEATWFATEEAFYSSASTESSAFEMSSFDAPVTTMPLVLGDVDNDGDLDIIAVGMQGESQVLVVYVNANGTFSSASKVSVELESPTHALVLANLDEDNGIEIALADDAGGSYVDVDIAAGKLALPKPLPGLLADSPAARSIAAADFDRDGVPDLVLGHEDGLSFYRGVARLP